MLNLIEDRGCGIKYTISEYLNEECSFALEDAAILNSKAKELNSDLVNGNGDPFTYYLEEI